MIQGTAFGAEDGGLFEVTSQRQETSKEVKSDVSQGKETCAKSLGGQIGTYDAVG